MQFNSYIFILVFFPLTIVSYYLANRISTEAGKILLIAAGIVFYGWADWSILAVLLISLALNYLFIFFLSGRVRWKKLFLFLPVAINVGLLLYFKYLNFFIWNIDVLFGKTYGFYNIVLPLGISFFTFQQIACLVSVSRGELPRLSLIDYLAFILYFPKLLMGPLMEPADFINQINDPALKKLNWDHIACGLKIFSFGLFKKMLLADTFSKAVEWGYSSISRTTSMDWILIMLFYTFEIYFDFSGYSDMATGTSLMLNITLPINFDSPYKALSNRDFWKRWHISLTKFLTKYIYIPLGGNRKGKLFTYLNTMVVFLVSGMWHGAYWTFILWGFLHGLLSIFDRITEKWQARVFRPIRWFFCFISVNILWLLFRSFSVIQWASLLRKALQIQSLSVSSALLKYFYLPEFQFLTDCIPALGVLSSRFPWIWMGLFLLAAFFICLIPENNYRRLHQNSTLTLFPAIIAFVWSVLCLSGETVFVYFNF